jgi:hypothetical protein
MLGLATLLTNSWIFPLIGIGTAEPHMTRFAFNFSKVLYYKVRVKCSAAISGEG